MDQKKPEWIFDDLRGSMASGPNAGPTVEFRGNPSYYIAREALQNIMDAHDENSAKPAEAEFSVISIPAKDLPEAEHLGEVLSSCALYLRGKGAIDTAIEFEKGAKKISQNISIEMLRISDHNTVGMTDENWFRFAESVGFSNKQSGSGGSFGLGKGAYYVSSGFLSLFISSIASTNSYVFAGKSIVTTFEYKGVRKQNNGTYGIGEQEPIRDRAAIPANFVKHFPDVFGRSRPGTDFLIPDFIGDENWESELVKSILRYFWLPIIMGKLVIKVQEGEVINSSTIERLLHKYFNKMSFQWDNTEAPNPLPLYYAYRRATPIEPELKYLGKVRLYLLPAEGYPNRVALVRKPGMVVDCIKKNSMNRYAAVFICDNKEGNSLLREMENQEHNEWKWENAKTEENRDKAKKAYLEMESFIKEELQKLSISKEERYLSIEGLEDFISMDIDEGSGVQGDEKEKSAKEYGDEATIETMRNLDLKVKKKILSIKERPDQVEPGIYIPKLEKKNGGKKKVGPKENNPRPLAGIAFLSFADSDSENNPTHYIQIKGEPGKKIDIIEVSAGGDDVSEKLLLKTVSADKTVGNEPTFIENEIHNLILNKTGERKLKVNFKDSGKYSLKLNAFEITKKSL
ncbi:MAG: hypothetical protein ABIH78_01015 [Candidatus Peregrinibacteria bacterium]